MKNERMKPKNERKKKDQNRMKQVADLKKLN